MVNAVPPHKAARGKVFREQSYSAPGSECCAAREPNRRFASQLERRDRGPLPRLFARAVTLTEGKDGQCCAVGAACIGAWDQDAGGGCVLRTGRERVSRPTIILRILPTARLPIGRAFSCRQDQDAENRSDTGHSSSAYSACGWGATLTSRIPRLTIREFSRPHHDARVLTGTRLTGQIGRGLGKLLGGDRVRHA
jgi:hypothetical protein